MQLFEWLENLDLYCKEFFECRYKTGGWGQKFSEKSKNPKNSKKTEGRSEQKAKNNTDVGGLPKILKILKIARPSKS